VWVIANAADYQLEVSLDECESYPFWQSHTHTTKIIAQKHWICLGLIGANRFKPDSRGTLTTPYSWNRYNEIPMADLRFLSFLQVGSKERFRQSNLINDTRMQVWLLSPIPLKEERPTFPWIFPLKFLKREWIEWEDFKWKMDDLCFAARYPKVAVFDDVEGWNVEPLFGCSEFYCEYGKILITRVTVALWPYCGRVWEIDEPKRSAFFFPPPPPKEFAESIW